MSVRPQVVDVFPAEQYETCEECGDWVHLDPDHDVEHDAVLCRRCSTYDDPREATAIAEDRLMEDF